MSSPIDESRQGQSLRLHYPTVIISDSHLGKSAAQADMLHEFLEYIECDKLYLLGDIIDGWYLMDHSHKPFDEMHARVIDSINRKAHQGTEVVYIPGNHDENLRARWNVMQRRLKKPKNKRGRHSILNKTFVFGHSHLQIHCPIRFVNGEVYTDPAGRKLLLLHGDQFDWKKLKTKWGQILSRVGDKAYDGLIKVNGYAVQFSRKYQGTNFSIAAYLKKRPKAASALSRITNVLLRPWRRMAKLMALSVGIFILPSIRKSTGRFTPIQGTGSRVPVPWCMMKTVTGQLLTGSRNVKSTGLVACHRHVMLIQIRNIA